MIKAEVWNIICWKVLHKIYNSVYIQGSQTPSSQCIVQMYHDCGIKKKNFLFLFMMLLYLDM